MTQSIRIGDARIDFGRLVGSAFTLYVTDPETRTEARVPITLDQADTFADALKVYVKKLRG
jgi:hypothetical protein